jgi:DNA end-binding protein Ku
MAATVWKGFLSFGLVSFPIRLFAAARPEPVRFHMLHKRDQSRIREVWYCAEEDKPVDRAEIVKGFEYAKGKYVVVEDDELKKVAPKTATTMEIQQFVAAGEVDALYFDKSYYVAPEEGASKPYVLLREAMTKTGFYAVAKVAMHSREHIVIIRPDEGGLVLHTMYFADELHEANRAPAPKDAKFSAKEFDLAKRLIDSLASPFKPEQYEDEYRKNVEKLIEQKRTGHGITAVAQPKAPKTIDIMEALRRSLETRAGAKKTGASKKPVKRARKAA